VTGASQATAEFHLKQYCRVDADCTQTFGYIDGTNQRRRGTGTSTSASPSTTSSPSKSVAPLVGEADNENDDDYKWRWQDEPAGPYLSHFFETNKQKQNPNDADGGGGDDDINDAYRPSAIYDPNARPNPVKTNDAAATPAAAAANGAGGADDPATLSGVDSSRGAAPLAAGVTTTSLSPTEANTFSPTIAPSELATAETANVDKIIPYNTSNPYGNNGNVKGYRSPVVPIQQKCFTGICVPAKLPEAAEGLFSPYTSSSSSSSSSFVERSSSSHDRLSHIMNFKSDGEYDHKQQSAELLLPDFLLHLQKGFWNWKSWFPFFEQKKKKTTKQPQAYPHGPRVHVDRPGVGRRRKRGRIKDKRNPAFSNPLNSPNPNQNPAHSQTEQAKATALPINDRWSLDQISEWMHIDLRNSFIRGLPIGMIARVTGQSTDALSSLTFCGKSRDGYSLQRKFCCLCRGSFFICW